MEKITCLFVLSLLLLTSTVQLTAQTISNELLIDAYDKPNDSSTLQNNAPDLHLRQGNKQQLDSFLLERYDDNTAQWKDDGKTTFLYDENENTTNRTIYIKSQVSDALVPKTQFLFTYDANQNQTFWSRSNWYSNIQQWVTDNRHDYEYDSNGNLVISYLYINWNPTTESWNSKRKAEYSYDSANHLIEIIQYNTDINDQWVPHWKTNYTYDANGNEVLEIDSYWYTNTQMWDFEWKRESIYDADNNLIEHISSSWQSATEVWQQDLKMEYSYDTNGNQILEILFSKPGGQWTEKEKIERTYDQANNETDYTKYTWNTDEWVNDYDVVRAYDAAGNHTLYESYSWDTDTEQWIGFKKEEYAYDADNNYVLFINYSWNDDTYQWQNDYRQNFNYDNNYPYSELILPYYLDEIDFRHKRTDYTQDTWDVATEQWITDTGRATYHYSGEFVGIENIIEANINVFPNPARDEVIFDLKNTPIPAMIELYDAQGQLVDVQSLNNNKISVRHLTSGVYFYQLFHESQQYGGKLIVR